MIQVSHSQKLQEEPLTQGCRVRRRTASWCLSWLLVTLPFVLSRASIQIRRMASCSRASWPTVRRRCVPLSLAKLTG